MLSISPFLPPPLSSLRLFKSQEKFAEKCSFILRRLHNKYVLSGDPLDKGAQSWLVTPDFEQVSPCHSSAFRPPVTDNGDVNEWAVIMVTTPWQNEGRFSPSLFKIGIRELKAP